MLAIKLKAGYYLAHEPKIDKYGKDKQGKPYPTKHKQMATRYDTLKDIEKDMRDYETIIEEIVKG